MKVVALDIWSQNQFLKFRNFLGFPLKTGNWFFEIFFLLKVIKIRSSHLLLYETVLYFIASQLVFTTLLLYYITTLLHNYITALLHYYITALLHKYITTLLHYYIITFIIIHLLSELINYITIKGAIPQGLQ